MSAMGPHTPNDTDPAAANVEGELAEDDLESVSGGMYPANKMSVVHLEEDLVAANIVPDTCKTPTPGGPVAIPYPNIATAAPTTKKK